jgi:hypothetical protein
MPSKVFVLSVIREKFSVQIYEEERDFPNLSEFLWVEVGKIK